MTHTNKQANRHRKRILVLYPLHASHSRRGVHHFFHNIATLLIANKNHKPITFEAPKRRSDNFVVSNTFVVGRAAIPHAFVVEIGEMRMQ